MKLLKKLLILIAVFVARNSYGMENPNKYLFNNYKERFIPQELAKHYLEDGLLKKELDKQSQHGPLIPAHDNVNKIEINGKEYYLKLDTSRIIGAALVNDLAHEYKLKVKAPLKKIYRALDGTEYCLAPVIPQVKRPFSLLQMRNIYKVIEVAGFDDAGCSNIIKAPDGTVYFIDTEEKSFIDVKDLTQWSSEQRALTLDTLKETTEMTDTATAFLSRKITKLNTATC